MICADVGPPPGPHKIAETDPDDDVACAVVRDVIAVGADLLSRGGTQLLPFFFLKNDYYYSTGCLAWIARVVGILLVVAPKPTTRFRLHWSRSLTFSTLAAVQAKTLVSPLASGWQAPPFLPLKNNLRAK